MNLLKLIKRLWCKHAGCNYYSYKKLTSKHSLEIVTCANCGKIINEIVFDNRKGGVVNDFVLQNKGANQ